MKVLIAGGTGAIGRPLVPRLIADGHEVTVLRRRASAPPPGHPEARVAVADALDRDALLRVVSAAEPEVIVNMLTAIPAVLHPRRFAQEFHLTARLREEATAALAVATRRLGGVQLISQGLAYAYDPGPGGPAVESDPLWGSPPAPFRETLAALRSLEASTDSVHGLVLRFGHLYGPGTQYDTRGSFTEQARRGQVPLVGEGRSIFSFTHTEDAANAIAAAIRLRSRGVLNVVDNDPAPMRDWLPHFAQTLGAPAPRRIPVPLARLAVGAWGVAFMSRLRGADNSAAKRELRWGPRYPSWRDGFVSSAPHETPSQV